MAVCLFTPLSTVSLGITTALQALSALLQPQGKMLQVNSETHGEAQENTPLGGSDAAELEGRTDKPADRCEHLLPLHCKQLWCSQVSSRRCCRLSDTPATSVKGVCLPAADFLSWGYLPLVPLCVSKQAILEDLLTPFLL